MRLVGANVVDAQTAHLVLTLADGSTRAFELSGPIAGSVEVAEEEIGPDTTTLGMGFSFSVTGGRKTVEVALSGTLAAYQGLGSP